MKNEDALKIKELYKNGYSIAVSSGYVDGFIKSITVANERIAGEYDCNNVKEGDVFIQSESLACSLESFSLSDISIYKEIDLYKLLKIV